MTRISFSSWLKNALFACLLGVVSLGSPGCDEATTSGRGSGAGSDGEGGELAELEGKIEIDGSSTVYPISEAAAEQFKKQMPKVKVTVAVSGTGGGFKRFAKGETDISDASRPIKGAGDTSEFAECKKYNVAFIELPVAYDGLSIVVNPENDFVEQLTVDDLKKIFLEEGGAKTWKDVNENWPEDEIKIYAPGTDSGTFDYFFGDVVAKDKDNEHPRSDMSVSEDDNNLVTGVAGEKGAIGFFGAAYYFENEDKVKAVPIVDPKTDKAVMVSPKTIESGEYAPFSRPLFIYVNVDSLKRPEMKKFVEFYLDNGKSLAEKAKYVGLPQGIYDAARKHYEDRLTGTHFLTAEMEKRVGPLAELYKADDLVDIE